MVRTPIAMADREHGRLLGLALARERRRLGRTASDVARAASLSVDTVRALEGGRIPAPGFLTVARLAREVEVSLDDLHVEASPGAAPAPGGPA